MRKLGESNLDPGAPALTSRRHRAGVFIADDGAKVTIRKAKPGTPELGLVRALLLSSGREFTPGTLLLPLTANDLGGVDPSTLRLFYRNEQTERYTPVPACGLNVEGGYAWARVTEPGRYALFGVPSPDEVRRLGVREIQRLHAANELGHLVLLSQPFLPSEPWQSLGPTNVSCCIMDLALDPNDGERIYAAASDGGVWRLDSVRAYPHESWIPLTDQQPSLKVTAVAVSSADAALVYYADTSGRLFRSFNSGYSWEQTSPTILGEVKRILTHPTDSNRVYVASSAGFWSSPSRGTGWDSNPGQMTLRDGNMSDADMDPANPATIYVGQREVGVLKTTDGGATWRTVLPWSAAETPVDNTVRVAVGGQGNPSTRTIAAKLDQEVFVSNTAGEPTASVPKPWRTEGKHGGTGQGWWNSVVAVDPHDDNVIFAGAQQLYRRDAQANWSLVVDEYKPHEDQHRMVFDRRRPGIAHLANDGGVFRSTDGGVTWQTNGDDVAEGRDLTVGLVTAQFFAAGINKGQAVANAYHQGILASPVLSTSEWRGIEGHSWEFSNIHGDQNHPGRYFVLAETALWRREFPNPASGPALVQIGSFSPSAVASLPAAGSSILLAATTSGNVLYAPNGGDDAPTWSEMAGISLAGDQVISLAFAPLAFHQRAFALTGHGRVFICEDVGGSAGWKEVKALPSGGARQIVVNAADQQQVFAVTSAHAYRSVTAGEQWEAIPGTGPNTIPVGSQLISLISQPLGVTYLAAQSGIYMSPDSGQNWFPEMTGLPNVEFTELLWENDDLFAVTQGRGLWHRRRYLTEEPPAAHIPDAKYLMELWKAIYGGDPGPELVLEHLGAGIKTIQQQRLEKLQGKAVPRAVGRAESGR